MEKWHGDCNVFGVPAETTTIKKRFRAGLKITNNNNKDSVVSFGLTPKGNPGKSDNYNNKD